MLIDTPFEFLVDGVPISSQGSAGSKAAWRQSIREALGKRREGWHWALEGPVHVTILYFPSAPMEGDIDNIVKPILDAMIGPVYVDDQQVERLLVEKFEPDRAITAVNPSRELASALARSRPVLYVRIDDERSKSGGQL